MHFLVRTGFAAAALIASFASANAQQYIQAGVLECQGGENIGFVVGSTTQFQCIFRSEGRPPEPYIAIVHRYGLDVGITAQTGLAWAVNSPTYHLGAGDLAGHYGGVGANATVGVGVGANLLVGGSANSFSLQPLSLQGQTGLNAAAGIVDLDLRPADLRVQRRGWRHRRHH